MRALVLSGGGSKGAFQAGMLKHILGDLQVQYDVLCGVSVGALNTAFLSMFPVGDELQAINSLLNMWDNINTPKIYKRWHPLGRIHALWEKSFYDSSPLQELVRNSLDLQKIRESGKQISVGAVSLNSGKYTTFDPSSDHFIEAVMASASFPGMLTPIKFLEQLWIDGGVKEMSPIKKAVELGADVIDVITTSPHTRVKNFIKNPNIIDILKRALDLSTDKIMSNDLEKIEVYNQLAQAGIPEHKYVKINILRPDHNLTDDLLDFDPIKIQNMIQKGYQDAKNKYIM